MNIKKINCLFLLCIILTKEVFAAEQDTKQLVATTTQKFNYVTKEQLVKTLESSLTALPSVIVHEIAGYCLEEKEQWIKRSSNAISPSATLRNATECAWALSPNGKYLARPALFGPKAVIISTAIPRIDILKLATTSRYNVENLKFSPNGKLLLWHEKCCATIVWHIEKDIEVITKENHYGSSFLPDNKSVLSITNDATIKIWDIYTGNILHTFPNKSHLQQASISPCGKVIMAIDNNNLLHTWELLSTVYKVEKRLNRAQKFIQRFHRKKK